MWTETSTGLSAVYDKGFESGTQKATVVLAIPVENAVCACAVGYACMQITDQLKYSPPIAKKVGAVTEFMWPQARWAGVVMEVI